MVFKVLLMDVLPIQFINRASFTIIEKFVYMNPNPIKKYFFADRNYNLGYDDMKN